MIRDRSPLDRRLAYLGKTVTGLLNHKEEDRYRFLQNGGWSQAGEYVFTRTVRKKSPLTETATSRLLIPDGLSREDLLFFDTETTGLSGGAGNMVFLLGTAGIRNRSLECEQIFLVDFPGEAEFLALIRQKLSEKKLFVSFNGKSFDSHVLKGRFILNGMDFELEYQNDLLYWARRLWKRRLVDCSLSSIEREILGIQRVQDVSGYEVPGIFFEYLRTGRAGRMPLVFSHNLQDTVTLARLFALLDRILNSPGRHRSPAETDMAALGSYLLKAHDPRGLAVLKASFARGDQRSGMILSRYYKRQGRWSEAVRLWKEMASAFRNSLARKKSLLLKEARFAHIELSKYYEHRRKDFRQALFWLKALLSDVSAYKDCPDLRKRKIRLEKKLKSSSQI